MSKGHSREPDMDPETRPKVEQIPTHAAPVTNMTREAGLSSGHGVAPEPDSKVLSLFWAGPLATVLLSSLWWPGRN